MTGHSTIEPYRRVSRQLGFKSGAGKKNFSLRAAIRALDWSVLGFAVAVFLLTRLRLLGELSPFGLAFWVVCGRGELKRMAFYGAVALFAAVTMGSTGYVLGLLLSMAVFYLLLDRLPGFKVPLPILAGVSLLAGYVPQLWFDYFHPYDVVLLCLEVLLAVLAVVIFEQVLSHRPVLSGEKGVEGVVAWVVFAGLMLLSLVQGGHYLPLLAGAIARLLVLWSAFMFGPGMAAATGALLGFLLGIQGSGLMWLSLLTFAGFFSGLFRPYGRLALSAGFIVSASSLCLYLAGWEAVRPEFALSGAAVTFFLLGPVLPRRVQALAPFLRRRVEDEGEQVRELTSTRIKDYALVFKELSEAFRHAATLETKQEPALSALAESVNIHICQNCASHRRCWDKDMRRTYNALLRMLADLDSGPGGREARTYEFFQRYCRRKEEFLNTLTLVKQLQQANGFWQKKMDSTSEFVSLQLSGLSEIMLELAKDIRSVGLNVQQKINRQFFHVEIGVAQASKGKEEICGDYYSYLELRDGRQAFILSDGMGNGSRAHLESSSTVGLVEQLLLAGLRQEQVIRTVNTILQLRSRDEIFATLDALLVDTEKGEAEFIKIGAAPSFLRMSGRVREVRSPSVPLGILSEVELKPVRLTVDDDALIVMVTDGIFDVSPLQPDWLKIFLNETDLNHPQVLADEILHQARALSGETEMRDDLTVLVCRVKRLKHRINDYVTGTPN
ncbi:MAG: SpoIIE family protein phosphatase [Dethiobacter sp.]|nr:SpoIIE family protein phosphatase [Dethiobacter sp.]